MEGRPTLRSFAVINQKGGCGKTTTAINLAASLAALGQRTLLIDVDPQSHCALGLAVPEKQLELSVADVFLTPEPTAGAFDDLFWQIATNLDLAPATVSLAGVERKLADAPDRDLRLARFLGCLDGRYDMVIIDCPPSIGLLTFNALRAATEVIIPVETGYFALKGAAKQVATINVMAQQCGHAVGLHILPTMYDVRIKLGREILNDLKRQFGKSLLPVSIHYNAKLKEATSFGQPITEYDPASRGRQDFDALARYLLRHVPPPQAPTVSEAAASDAKEMAANGRSMASIERAVHRTASDAAARVEAATESFATAAAEPEPSTPSDRAIELVQRARALAARTAALNARIASQPPPPSPQRPADRTERRAQLNEKLARLYGARQTEAGMLFVQPLDCANRVHIAGDFNNWSARDGAFKRNDALGVWELCVPLQPGRYRYRLVIDGRWTTDPHNTNVETNPFGELNNIVEVKPTAKSESLTG